MRYPKGNPIPANVVAALRLTGKIGFLSRALWRRHFTIGAARAGQIQLKRLGESEHKLLARHPNPIARDYFVLSKIGRELAEQKDWSVVAPASIAQIKHDEVVADAMMKLDTSRIIRNWKSEPEMKKSREFALNDDPSDGKYPDAVMEIILQGQSWRLALEYERTRKSANRYKDILWLYSKMMELKLVIFVCETAVIEKAIRNQMIRLALPRLYGRIAFTTVEAWNENPGSAPIRLEERTFTLMDLTKIEALKVAA